MSSLDQLRQLRFYHLAAKTADVPKTDLPEIVMAGRSNVGKSSLINALAGQNHLARVSQTPGKTRQVIYFILNHCLLLTDLPGYGYARVAKNEKKRFSDLVEDYFALQRSFCLVLHLMDIRHRPSDEDRMLIAALQSMKYKHALVFTKCDKLSRAQLQRRLQELSADLDWDEASPVFAVSSIKKLGIEELGAYILAAARGE